MVSTDVRNFPCEENGGSSIILRNVGKRRGYDWNKNIVSADLNILFIDDIITKASPCISTK